MINDNTIDRTTAKCWCIFSDVDLIKQLQKQQPKKQQIDEGIIDSFMRYAGILVTVSSVVGLIGPYFSSIIRKMKYEKTETIANIKFEADDVDYVVNFNINKCKWILTGGSDTQRDTVQFFNTKFFKEFLKSCQSYISIAVQNEKIILENIDKIKDSKSKDFIKYFYKNKDRILTNMFNVVYLA